MFHVVPISKGGGISSVGERSLEAWLWDAANILRGPVDASDFKAYVFPLLFLKRISDVYDEEAGIWKRCCSGRAA